MQRKEPLQGQRKDTKRCFVVWVVVFFGGGGEEQVKMSGL